MVADLAQHFGRLFHFSGREARRPFWIWVAFNLILQMVMCAVMAAPLIGGSFARIERFAAEHPDQVTRTFGPGGYSIQVHGYHPELMPDFSGLIPIFAIGVAAAVFLLGAAVVRRLHDTGRSGIWGLLPLPFLAGGLLMMNRLFKSIGVEAMPDLGLFALVFLNNAVYLTSLLLLAFFCSRPGTGGANRFGPPPA